MRLPELLSQLDRAAIERLALDKLPERDLAPAFLAGSLEGVLRSYSYIQRAVVRRQPPTFAILLVLSEAEGRRTSRADLRSGAALETEALCERLAVPGGLGRESELHLYRRVLAEARRSELDLDPSETALLGVLRRELGISHVEHYIMEHHPDLQIFWRDGDSFERELGALLDGGIVFSAGDTIVVPDDTASIVRQSIGIRLRRQASRRLYGLLSGAELAATLIEKGAKSAGSKDEKVERLIANFVQANEALKQVNLAELRDIARNVECNISGTREDLAERLIIHFDRDEDLQAAEPESVSPAKELRELDEARFRLLLAELTGQQMAEVLSSNPELRQSGTKDVRITTLWQSHLSETSILTRLTSRDIEDVLGHLDLRLSGSKAERVQRLIAHFKSTITLRGDAGTTEGGEDSSP